MPGHEPIRDPLIAEVTRQLRRTAPVSQDLDARVWTEINRGPVAPKSPIRWIALAVAAGLALLALVIGRSGAHGVDGGIAFSIDAPQATRVSLVGDFNNWDPAATPLARGAGGRWETVVPLRPGRYQFTFVVDGNHWVRDLNLPQAVGDDFGQPTSVITVPHRSRS